MKIPQKIWSTIMVQWWIFHTLIQQSLVFIAIPLDLQPQSITIFWGQSFLAGGRTATSLVHGGSPVCRGAVGRDRCDLGETWDNRGGNHGINVDWSSLFTGKTWENFINSNLFFVEYRSNLWIWQPFNTEDTSNIKWGFIWQWHTSSMIHWVWPNIGDSGANLHQFPAEKKHEVPTCFSFNATNELDVSKNGDEWGTLYPENHRWMEKTRGFPYFPLIFRQIQLRGP